MKFEKGNTIGKGGRPRYSRSKLDAYVYACALTHVQHKKGEPLPAEYEHTNLWNALTLALRESPRDYLARIIAMLPKQVSFEHSVIADLRARALAAPRDERDLIELKALPDVTH